MKLLGQLAIILAFGLAGDFIGRLLPFALPSSVIGLVLLLLFLKTGLLKISRVEEVGSFLTANMAFFFLPSAVAVMSHYRLIAPVLLQLVVICVLSTALAFGAAYGAARLVRRAMGKGGRA